MKIHASNATDSRSAFAVWRHAVTDEKPAGVYAPALFFRISLWSLQHPRSLVKMQAGKMGNMWPKMNQFQRLILWIFLWMVQGPS
jgi:hypothetical protein